MAVTGACQPECQPAADAESVSASGAQGRDVEFTGPPCGRTAWGYSGIDVSRAPLPWLRSLSVKFAATVGPNGAYSSIH